MIRQREIIPVIRSYSKLQLSDVLRFTNCAGNYVYACDYRCSEVSERASYDSRELVAEIKLGLQSGKKYPNDLMELYNKFGGN